MYLKTSSKKECYGCTACSNSCAKNAINMTADNEGFLYPEINKDLCISCGKCIKVCPYDFKQENNDIIAVYASWNNSIDYRNTCASGGVFFTIAEHVIQQRGLVVGATFSDDYKEVKHIVVDSYNDLIKLKKSKYVQSNLNNIFIKVKDALLQKKAVLFSGTPCQISGLVSFLGNKPENLILCELFCYGVPSPFVYQKYIEYLENKYSSKVINVNFKDKRFGWDYYTTEITFASGKKLCEFGGDSYRFFMGKGYSLRPSCLTCMYDYKSSVADFTLGDFYTYNKYISINPPKNGINCIVVRTKIVNDLLNKLSSKLFLSNIDVITFSENETHDIRKFDIDKRNEFFKLLNNSGYENTLSLIKNKKLKERLVKNIIAVKKRFLK